MRVIEILLIISTLLGPVLAVQAQKWIERATEHRRRKQWIFETLMATRATRLVPEHVRALNQIELEFSGTDWFGFHHRQTPPEQQVIDRWREYTDVLSQTTPEGDTAAASAWLQRADDHFITLLQAIASALGYHYDQAQLRRGIYYPRGFSDAERKQQLMQDALARVLLGTQPISMNVAAFPQPTDEAAAKQEKVQDVIINAFGPDGALRIRPTDQSDDKPK